MISLIDVYTVREASGILFDLLKERTPEQSISHKSMPSMEEHINFVRSVPYRAWFLIQNEANEYAGSCYLTDQYEIGVFIFKKHQQQGYGKEAVEAIMGMYRGPFLANVNPKNKASAKLFEGLGFTHIQNTFGHD
jgi:RimJ/RimL family protein N-acetyltransferase